MEQHAIPQNISSYQFRLVGDMTLKQFFQLAGGLLVSLIFYSAPLVGIIKWPFVILSAILGVALAFLPLEERPLEKWIFAFFRAIYAPTEFFWKKITIPPKIFQDEPAAPVATPGPQEQAVEQYLSSPGQKTEPTNKLENAERGFFATLMGIASGLVSPTKTPAVVPVPQQPEPVAKPEINIPQNVPVKVPAQVPHLVVEEKRQEAVYTSPQISATQVNPSIVGNEMVSTTAAIFSVDAAPPNPPTYPNVVVGQVVDAERKIIEGAIMEIRDSSGRPVRALRSNKVGHFITITPLENGNYQIVTEKEDHEFTPVSFEVVGQIIPPILVQGRRIIQEVIPTGTIPTQVQSSVPTVQ